MTGASAQPLPRLLVLMGSGETSPTMVKVHRRLLARLGPPPVPAVLLDTPFGFQANASDIAGRAIAYFAESVGQEVTVAGYRSAAEIGTVEHETMLNRLRKARYIFAGPGSPSYALRQWTGSLVPEIMSEKLVTGGCITFASAAALTLGVATVPVYEIYKVGAEPEWLPGLNLLARVGLHAAVIPHYDNAEGGNHDTRFCYLGEHRLSVMERQLPEGAFVLGVDEHTACILDLDDRSATVVGRGTVTIRAHGRSEPLVSGTTVPVAQLGETAERLRLEPGRPGSGPSGERSAPAPRPSSEVADAGRHAGDVSPFLEMLAGHDEGFAAAVEGGDVPAAVAHILDLQRELAAWSADTFQSDELDRGRAVLRSMIVRLGEMAGSGPADPHHVVAPFVEVLLDLRGAARHERRWADADIVRDRLVTLGVEVNDGPEGTTWALGG